jgi:proteasome lid subunit RPN8/RPN11
VGWYHTGPRLREADLDIHELMTNYVNNPVLVVSEVEVSCTAVFGNIVCIAMH